MKCSTFVHKLIPPKYENCACVREEKKNNGIIGGRRKWTGTVKLTSNVLLFSSH